MSVRGLHLGHNTPRSPWGDPRRFGEQTGDEERVQPAGQVPASRRPGRASGWPGVPGAASHPIESRQQRLPHRRDGRAGLGPGAEGKDPGALLT